MPLASIILACLLAFVATGSACCCAVEPASDAGSCCGGGPAEESSWDRHCGCAEHSPGELPAPDLLPALAGGPPDLSAVPAPRAAFRHARAAVEAGPRWTPARPWHAPPAERRARLVRRTL
jgi:hypothetical protein